MAVESGHDDAKHGFITWGRSLPEPDNRCETCHASLDVAKSKFTLSTTRAVTVKLQLHDMGTHHVFTMNEVDPA